MTATYQQNLAAAIAARDAARVTYERDAADLVRGRKRLGIRTAELERATSIATQAADRRARGEDIESPGEQLEITERLARRDVEALQRLVATLEAGERESKATLDDAQEAVEAAARTLMGQVDGLALAERVSKLRAELAQAERLLNALHADDVMTRYLPGEFFVAVGDDLNTPVHMIPARGDLGTPVNQIGRRLSERSGHDHWATRLAALMRGEGIETLDTPAKKIA